MSAVYTGTAMQQLPHPLQQEPQQLAQPEKADAN